MPVTRRQGRDKDHPVRGALRQDDDRLNPAPEAEFLVEEVLFHDFQFLSHRNERPSGRAAARHDAQAIMMCLDLD
jgi:hypothetical protein